MHVFSIHELTTYTALLRIIIRPCVHSECTITFWLDLNKMFIKVPLCKQAPLFGVNRYTVYLWRCSGLSCRVNLRCLFIPTLNISLDWYEEHNLADSICQQSIPWCLHTPCEATLYYSLSHTNEKSEQFVVWNHNVCSEHTEICTAPFSCNSDIPIITFIKVHLWHHAAQVGCSDVYASRELPQNNSKGKSWSKHFM